MAKTTNPGRGNAAATKPSDGRRAGAVSTAAATASPASARRAPASSGNRSGAAAAPAAARGLRSMTGYGTATVPIPNGRLTIEIRSVNQRFLDVRVTAPREYAPWEASCRETVRARVARGRVDVYVSRSAPATGRAHVVLDLAAAREYAAAWKKLKRALGLTGALDLGLFRGGEVFQTVQVPVDVAAELAAAGRALERALEHFDRERRREGAHLQRDMLARIDRLAALQAEIQTIAAGTVADAHAKLTERLERLLKGTEIDLTRVAQEAAVLADRSDVTEELVRLASHLAALKQLLSGKEPVGKQIEFLLQEVHREINTIGSKVNDLRVTKLVIEAKGEGERLREQVQNVE